MRNCVTMAALIGGVLLAASAARAQDAAAGAEVYAENCASCHGERMISTGAAFDLRKLGPDERERFNTSVTEGKGQMPAWGGMLTDEQFDELWAYIRSRADR